MLSDVDSTALIRIIDRFRGGSAEWNLGVCLRGGVSVPTYPILAADGLL